MGRHRNDPRGAGQIAAIVGAVVLFLTLVILGGYFLYRSLPGNNNAAAPGEVSTSAGARLESTASAVLHIKVIGESSQVLVRVPGGAVLTDSRMERGQFVSYNRPELAVTLGDPDAVAVRVNGRTKDVSGEDPGYSFTVRAEDPV